VCLGVVCGLNVLYIDTPRLLGWGACGAFLHNAEHATADGASLNSRRSTTTRPPAPCRLAQRGEDPLAVALGNGVGDVEETGLVDHVHLPYGIHLSVKSETLPHVVIILLSRLGLHHLHYCVYIPQILPANFSNNLRNSIHTRSLKKEEPRNRRADLLKPHSPGQEPKRKDPASTSAATSISCLSSVLVSAFRTLVPGCVSSTKSSAKARSTSPVASLSRLGGCTPRRGFWRRCAGCLLYLRGAASQATPETSKIMWGLYGVLLDLSCGCPRHYAKPAEASSAGRQAAYAATAVGVEKLLHLRRGPTAGHFIKTSKPHAIHFYVVF
jgi:hypothetical protein